MAESWGGGNPVRCYFVYSVTNYAASQTIALTGYINLVDPKSSGGTYVCGWTGWWGSGSNSVYRGIGPGYGSASSKIASGSYSISKNYGSTRSASFRVYGNTYHGYAEHTVSFTIPARAYSKPRPPKSQAVVRNSDTSATVSWATDYDSASGAQPWSGVYIDRWSETTGTWTRVASVSWSTTSWTDTGIVANNRYRYRVMSYNSAGSSTAANTDYIATTPSAPNGVVAQKQTSLDIKVTWSNTANYQTGANIYDNDVLVGTVGAGISEFTDIAPEPTEVHVYKVTALADSLESEKSAASAPVQLEAPPNAPTNVQFSKNVYSLEDETYDIIASWQHNPVDSSIQRKYIAEVRPVGTSTWRNPDGQVNSPIESTSPGDIAYALTLYNQLDPGTFEFRVRTWGSHADPGPYSATATFDIENNPAVAVVSPEPDEIIDHSRITAEWSYSQAQSKPQQRVNLTLKRGATEVWSQTITTAATSYEIPYTLQDDQDYTLTIEVFSSSNLSSDTQTIAFSVDYAEPSVPALNIEFDPKDGSHTIDINNPEEPIDAELNRVYRNINQDSEWMNVDNGAIPGSDATQLFTNPNLVGDDTWAEVRRNYLKGANSLSGALLANFTGTTRSIVTDPVGLEGQVVEVVTTTGSGGISQNVTSGAATMPAGAGTFSARFRAESGALVRVGVQEYSPSISLLGEQWTSWRAATGVWEDDVLSYTVTAADSLTRVAVQIQSAGTFWWKRSTAETGTTQGKTFDGSTMDDTMPQPEDFRVRWLGAENASESVMEIERVAGLTPNNCIVGVSSWEGKPAARMIPTTASNETYAQFLAPVAARSGGTLIGTLHLREPLAGSVFAVPRSLGALQPIQRTTPAPNVAGSYPLRLEFGALASDYRQLFVHGHSRGAGDAWWTDIGLFAGEYDGSAFGGPGSGVLENGIHYDDSWTGTPDNSPTVRRFSYPEVINDEWEIVGEYPPNTSLIDYEGLTYGKTAYRVEAVSSIPSSRVAAINAVAYSKLAYLGAGADFSNVATIPYDIEFDDSDALAFQEEHYFDGAILPMSVTGDAVAHKATVSGRLDPLEEEGSTLLELRRVVRTAGSKVFRDLEGRRIYVNVRDMGSARKGRINKEISLSMTEVQK